MVCVNGSNNVEIDLEAVSQIDIGAPFSSPWQLRVLTSQQGRLQSHDGGLTNNYRGSVELLVKAIECAVIGSFHSSI